MKGNSTTVNQNRIIEKTLSKNSKEVVKEIEISPGIPKQPLQNILGFKGIQTFQVLEA